MKSCVSTLVARLVALFVSMAIAVGALVVVAPQAQAHGEGTEISEVGLEALRWCESGGNYGITGKFHGAYQFTQRTWNFSTIEAGVPEWSGHRPNVAPPEVQDAVTRWLWQADPAKYNGPHAWPVCHKRALEAMWSEPTEKVLLLGDAAVVPGRMQLLWWFQQVDIPLAIEASPHAAPCHWVDRLPELVAKHRPTRIIVASSMQPPTSTNGCAWDVEHWGTPEWQEAIVSDAQNLTNHALNLGVEHVHWLDALAYPEIDSVGLGVDRNDLVESLEDRINNEVGGLTPIVSLDDVLGVSAVGQAEKLYDWESATVPMRSGDTFDEQFVGTDYLQARMAANLAKFVVFTS